MKNLTIYLPSVVDCEKLAMHFASCLNSAAVLTFSGEIGAGKTTFIRAMLKAKGIKSAIKSPTFSLVETYQYQDLQIHHFDLYRIQDEVELEYIGFRDYFGHQSICCIEWAEKASHSLLNVDLQFALSLNAEGRLMHIIALTKLGEGILSCVASIE